MKKYLFLSSLILGLFSPFFKSVIPFINPMLVYASSKEASMGTAIEMWEAHTNARFLITITPLIHNWVVQITSNVVYENVSAFVQSLRSGDIDKLIAQQTHS